MLWIIVCLSRLIFVGWKFTIKHQGQYGLQRVPWCQRLFLHCLRLEFLDVLAVYAGMRHETCVVFWHIDLYSKCFITIYHYLSLFITIHHYSSLFNKCNLSMSFVGVVCPRRPHLTVPTWKRRTWLFPIRSAGDRSAPAIWWASLIYATDRSMISKRIIWWPSLFSNLSWLSLNHQP